MQPAPSRNSVVLPGGFVLRPAAPDDLRATAGAHVRLLPVGLFPALGARFVHRWHRSFLRMPHSVGLVVVDPSAPGEQVVGFLLGSTDQAAHTEAVLTDRRVLLRLAWAGFFALLRRPRLAVRFVRTRGSSWLVKLLRRGRPQPAPAVTGRPAPVAVLAAIAVEPNVRGHGIGAHLVRRFLVEARAAGADVAELVTEAGRGATTFYERLGWRPAGERVTRDGATVCTYHCVLSDLVEQPETDAGREEGENP